MGVLDHMISNSNPTGQDNTWTLSSKGKVEGFHTTATVGWQNHFSGMGAPEEGPPSLCEKAKTPPVRSLALLGMTATSFQAHDAQLPTRPSRKSKPSSGIPRKSSEGIKKTTTTFVMKDGMSKFAVKVTRQPRTAEQRREVALTRKTGACIGCRLWRVPVRNAPTTTRNYKLASTDFLRSASVHTGHLRFVSSASRAGLQLLPISASF